MIKHIVMWKFKEGKEKEMHEFLDGLKALDGQIEEIVNMEIGININPKNNYDAILISKFKTMEDLEKYKKNPKHVAVSTLCKSIRENREAIDFKF